ncbi:hypothetical protein DCC24_05330 [Auritidibacter sp. NML100628]|nr:hypothetical protein DCC24_05330 [Auritidibacter sp. NML100628]
MYHYFIGHRTRGPGVVSHDVVMIQHIEAYQNQILVCETLTGDPPDLTGSTNHGHAWSAVRSRSRAPSVQCGRGAVR